MLIQIQQIFISFYPMSDIAKDIKISPKPAYKAT